MYHNMPVEKSRYRKVHYRWLVFFTGGAIQQNKL